MDGRSPLPVHRHRHRRGLAMLALLVCLLAALLAANPKAEASPGIGGDSLETGSPNAEAPNNFVARQSGTTRCAKAKRVKNRKGVKRPKGKRRKKRACRRPIAPIPSAPSLPTAPPPPPDACGARIPDNQGAYWDCTFVDDFGGATLNASSWVPQRTDTSGYQNGPTACFVDDPDNISVSDGTLKLTARQEPAPFTCQSPLGDYDTEYTSGMVSTYGEFSQTYGRFEVRAKVSDAQVPGLQSALWLWPDDPNHYGPWPASGEIDIAEMFSQYPDRAVPFIHYDDAGGNGGATNTSCLISNLDEFHTYAVEWTSSGIRVLYDGQTCLLHVWDPADPLVSPQPFDQPFLVILTQALGIGTNEFDPDTTPLPATTEVDYVRVWE
jgi:beta-glucanase (GH16 family)